MKSHRPLPRRPRAGFTLIELLIVIVIIAILAGVAFPVTAMVMGAARKAEAANEVKNIVNAISMYELEYGRLPLKPGAGDAEFDSQSGDLIAILSGVNVDELNPREKSFLDTKRATIEEGSPPRGGSYGSGDQIYLADPWGGPYYIKLDGDYDGKLSGLPGLEGEELRKKFAAWSEGEVDDEGNRAPMRKWVFSWQG